MLLIAYAVYGGCVFGMSCVLASLLTNPLKMGRDVLLIGLLFGPLCYVAGSYTRAHGGSDAVAGAILIAAASLGLLLTYKAAR